MIIIPVQHYVPIVVVAEEMEVEVEALPVVMRMEEQSLQPDLLRMDYVSISKMEILTRRQVLLLGTMQLVSGMDGNGAVIQVPVQQHSLVAEEMEALPVVLRMEEQSLQPDLLRIDYVSKMEILTPRQVLLLGTMQLVSGMDGNGAVIQVPVQQHSLVAEEMAEKAME